MAKAFDDNERKLIKDKLKEGALLFIQQQGVRKTTVDELVKYANISKGAYYLFYTSFRKWSNINHILFTFLG